MFKHSMDKLCEERFKAQAELIQNLTDSLKALNDAQRDIEDKLDQLLSASDNRSIPNEGKKPEPLGIMPGHIPWSQRKRQREQATRSPEFIEKAIKSAATTEKPETPEE